MLHLKALIQCPATTQSGIKLARSISRHGSLVWRWRRLHTPLSTTSLRHQTSLTCTRHSLLHPHQPPPPLPMLLHHRKLFGLNSELSAVKEELDKRSKEKGTDVGTKVQQLALYKALTKDVSDPTIALVAKLNCDIKLPPQDVYDLGVAILEASNNVSEGLYLVGLAAHLFGYAGEQGDHNALYTYAQLLRTGQGVKMDATKAADILSDLSMKGHPHAQFALGGMHYTGSGVEQSFQKAYTLYKVCSKNYIPQAFNVLGNMHQHGQGVEEDMKSAIEFYTKGCEFGDPHAFMSMAYCYTHGKGVETSLEKAFENYLEASKSNNPVALYNVATHYFAGQGVKQSMEKAKEYFEKASILGFYPAQFNLGNMYYVGLGVAKDREKAKELFHLAAEVDDNAKEVLKAIEEEEKKEGEKKEEELARDPEKGDTSS